MRLHLLAQSLRSFRRRWCGTGGWNSVSGTDVISPPARIFFGSQIVGLVLLIFCDLLEQFFQISNAPPATGPRTAAFADLTRNTRFVNADEVSDLPLGDVKTVTNFVIGFQSEPSSRDFTDSLQSNSV